MSFSNDISRWVEKATGKLREAQQLTAEIALEGVIARSPVGDPETWRHPPPPGYHPGTFKANWNVAIGAPDLSVRDVQDPTGAATFAGGMATIEGARLGDSIFITNALPYAHRLEFDGWSQQAPAGMVRVTAAGLAGELQRRLPRAT